MSAIHISIDGKEIEVEAGQTVLAAARGIGVEIPTLCHLEKCGPLTSCLVCLVKVKDVNGGKLVPSCATKAVDGMKIESETDEVRAARRTALELLLSDHAGDCLSPCQRLCPLGLNIPFVLRQIQSGWTHAAATTMRAALPMAGVLGRLCHHPCEQGCRRSLVDDAAAIRDLERWAADQSAQQPGLYAARRAGPRGKSVVIVGAGPAGLSAAHSLARSGFGVTVIDRNDRVGGSLRKAPESELPASVMAADTAFLEAMGVRFSLKIELGREVTMEGLLRGFDAVLVATGEPDGGSAKAPVDAAQGVFAAGSAVKPVKQLVKAMAEGKSAAEKIERFLLGQPEPAEHKPFSSVMGRMEKAELQEFACGACASPRIEAADVDLTETQAAAEAGRCLHCDCPSAGNCSLQSYARSYGADPARFRTTRRTFHREAQAGGVLFEPGKCITCGICVRLAELAQEELGLAFIGRGFTVRVAAPFGHAISDGMRKVAAECVEHCPTGALQWPPAGYLSTAKAT